MDTHRTVEAIRLAVDPLAVAKKLQGTIDKADAAEAKATASANRVEGMEIRAQFIGGILRLVYFETVMFQTYIHISHDSNYSIHPSPSFLFRNQESRAVGRGGTCQFQRRSKYSRAGGRDDGGNPGPEKAKGTDRNKKVTRTNRRK